MASKRDWVTLERLVKTLDNASSPPSNHLTHLKLQAAVKHARELLAAAREQSDPEFYPPSTSRNAAPPRDSLADFEARIARADQKLLDSWELVSASSRPATPVDGGVGGVLDLDFLLPTLPPPMPIPRSTRPKSPTTSSDTPPSPPSSKKPRKEKPVLVNSTTQILSNPTSPLSLSNEFELAPHPSDLSFTPPPITTNSGLRHRTAPPWLRNRELKEKQKQKEREQEEEESKRSLLEKENLSSTSPPNRRNARTANPSVLDDLLPGDTRSSVTSSDLLSHHHSLQSSLLSDLTSLSTALKTSTQTFSDNLQKDKEVMEEASNRLERNEGKIKVEGERLKGLKGKTRGTTCWTLGILAVVAAMWVGVFLLIKVT